MNIMLGSYSQCWFLVQRPYLSHVIGSSWNISIEPTVYEFLMWLTKYHYFPIIESYLPPDLSLQPNTKGVWLKPKGVHGLFWKVRMGLGNTSTISRLDFQGRSIWAIFEHLTVNKLICIRYICLNYAIMKGLSIHLYQYINVAIWQKMWTIQDWLFMFYMLNDK